MKLELKHIAPYLPYDIKIHETNYYPYSIWHVLKHQFKPILRPLSDLVKDVEINGEVIVPINKIDEIFGDRDTSYSSDGSKIIETCPLLFDEYRVVYENANRYPYFIIQKLLEWHFDVFGLIKEGLAVDINTLK